MKKISDKLKNYAGANPFSESQAKAYSDEKIANEFFPITLYWSLFNEQHEILIGTRGSGKTVILRMLSYSCLRLFKHRDAQKLKEEKHFIGFYVPLHLEFMASLKGKKIPAENKLEYFQFAFNCCAAKSFLEELKKLVKDCFGNADERLKTEYKLIKVLTEMWFPDKKLKVASISDLQWQIELLYQNQPFWIDGNKSGSPSFARPILDPLRAVLNRVSDIIGLNSDKTHWLACIDEAEFLKEPYLKCINTFLRSEKRPLVVKLATLPFKYSTRETLTDGVSVEANGNDFNFRIVDRNCDSDDFVKLTNHILSRRLAKCALEIGEVTLESFLGVVGKDDMLDYFRLEMGDHEASEKTILKGIIDALSKPRRERFKKMEHENKKVKSQYFKKFSPVYYMRKMKLESSKGHRKVGWFAGANIIRKVADGNPRRFIQIMNDLVEMARKKKLSPRKQHEVVEEFAKRHYDSSEGLPEDGYTLKYILDDIGPLLQKRVHEGDMFDGGCHFTIDQSLIENEVAVRAIKLGMGYSFIFADEETLYLDLSSKSDIRLAYICAIHYWLTMRKGSPALLKTTCQEEIFNKGEILNVPVTKKASQSIVEQLNLDLIITENED